MVPDGARFRNRERLKTGGQFRWVFGGGTRFDGRLFLLVARCNGLSFVRLGLAVSRKVGSAVVRNRAKRLLREAFRRHKGGWVSGEDLILVAKPGLGATTQADVDREVEKRRRQLTGRRRTRGRGQTPSGGD